MGQSPSDITGTHYRPSKLLLIHALWLMSSVVIWVGVTLFTLDIALNELFPDLVGIEDYGTYGMRVSAPIGYTILAVYSGASATWTSWMWIRSLHRSLAHFRCMNGVRDGGVIDDSGHHLAPFRKATGWAIATWPLLLGYGVLTFVMFPPFQG